MAFRKQDDDWVQFVREHEKELHACGVAASIYRSQQRFFLFLQEERDVVGWAEGKCLFADITVLRPEQAKLLAEFIRRRFARDYSGFAANLDRYAASLDSSAQINST